MEKVAFIGGYDKVDMILYVSKILTMLGKKVLIVDGTIAQKARYLIPTLTPTLTYITTNDGVDFAIGFDSMEKLENYLSAEGGNRYDFMMFDIDSKSRYKGFGLMPEDKHYLATSFDVYSLRKAVEVLKAVEMKTAITKIYFSRTITDDKDRYLRLLLKDCNVALRKDPVVFPTDVADLEAIQKNQRDNMIRFRGLSAKYLYGIMYIAEEVSGESSGNIKRVIKQFNR